MCGPRKLRLWCKHGRKSGKDSMTGKYMLLLAAAGYFSVKHTFKVQGVTVCIIKSLAAEIHEE